MAISSRRGFPACLQRVGVDLRGVRGRTRAEVRLRRSRYARYEFVGLKCASRVGRGARRSAAIGRVGAVKVTRAIAPLPCGGHALWFCADRQRVDEHVIDDSTAFAACMHSHARVSRGVDDARSQTLAAVALIRTVIAASIVAWQLAR